ncbi:MAG: sulfatase [Patescibacteria group bacterium]|nr:sulfatase [Patescibacteria group bacterium]
MCRTAVLSLAAGWLALIASPATAVAEPAQRPNILFIMADDHATEALSCYGSYRNKTPNLDRLAEQGMRFTNCFCTNSICGPSRAAILTGKYSHLNGFAHNGHKFDGSQQTVAKLMQAAGYQTAMIGKWHLGTDPTGFDHWEILIGQGPYYNPPMKTADGMVHHDGYTTDVITDLTLDFLKRQRDPGKPFLLMYQHKAPHREWLPGPDELGLFRGETVPEPPTLFDDYAGRGTAARQQEMTIARHMRPVFDLKIGPPAGGEEEAKQWDRLLQRLTPEQRKAIEDAYREENEAFARANLKDEDLVRDYYQRYIKDYLRTIAGIDRNVGRVLDYLEESGLAENTVVIYTSDQGFYLGEHGWYDKRFMYEESLRSPLLIRWPGKTKAGSKCEQMVMNLDFAETFLDLAGAPIPADMQGASIKPLLLGKTPEDWRRSIYYRYYEYPAVHMVNKHYGVRTDRYKLIYFHELGEWELFDLEKDPRELNSVYADPAHARIVQELKQELTRLRKQYQDDDAVAVR